jgi:hypothetical protein
MPNITIPLLLAFTTIALTRKEASTALGIIIISMLIWPEFLRVPIGPVMMSIPRLIALLLVIKVIFGGLDRQFIFVKTDALVILIWIWTILGTVVSGAETYKITQMIGRGLDTVLMYFVARIAFVGPYDVKKLYNGLAFIALAMCCAGLYEAITWSSPYHKFSDGAARIVGYSEIRYGFLRAQGSTMVSIYFGMAMMLVTGLLWAVRGYIEKQFIFKMVLFATVLATLSSFSSGPWVALFVLIIANLYYKKTSLIKPTLCGLIFISFLMEILSDRHFYNLIDYIAIDSQTAWYRTRLMEIAVSQWQEYWLIGVGGNTPHHWAAMLDGRAHIDIVNNFIIIALYGGFPALFMFLASHYIAIKAAIKSFKNEQDIPHRKLIFGLAATLVALDISSMSVGLFGPALLLSYILLGLIISVTLGWDNKKDS